MVFVSYNNIFMFCNRNVECNIKLSVCGQWLPAVNAVYLVSFGLIIYNIEYISLSFLYDHMTRQGVCFLLLALFTHKQVHNICACQVSWLSVFVVYLRAPYNRIGEATHPSVFVYAVPWCWLSVSCKDTGQSQRNKCFSWSLMYGVWNCLIVTTSWPGGNVDSVHFNCQLFRIMEEMLYTV